MDRTRSRATSTQFQPYPASPSGAKQHVLPPLPYDYSALEPFIDAATMRLHHDEHHAGYVDKLNEAIEPYVQLHGRSATWLLVNREAIPESVRIAVHQNAGGHANHSLFWRVMSPAGGNSGPARSLGCAIDGAFGSLERFKSRFDELGAKVFGSGWVWLVGDCDTKSPALEIVTTSGHDNPIEQGKFPLLVNDVWEHAYYLKHQNRRAEYFQSWWAIVDWKEVDQRFERLHESPTMISD